MREDQTDVLVVGAGPVGLVTALLLAKSGVQIRIIDQEKRTTSRSYACALDPGVLGLLDRLGIASAVLERGRQVSKIAFYDGNRREAELDLSKVGGSFPFAAILPQSTFEQILEHKLNESFGVQVAWNHRFDDLQAGPESVSVAIEKLTGTSTGYIVPHWETVVQKRLNWTAKFLVGADGHNSLVRQRLGLEYVRVSGPEYFAAYEFESDTSPESEVRVILDDKTTNVLWPLPGKKARWTFQMIGADLPTDFPAKERRAIRVEQPAIDEAIKQYVQKVAAQRAPWFKMNVREVTWCTDVAFEHRLCRPFGEKRCWVSGDAAHQTGPVGAQSMNVGMLEADALARKISDVVRGRAAIESLDSYNRERDQEWSELLGINAPAGATAKSGSWVAKRAGRLLSCIPASGPALAAACGQLGLILKSGTEQAAAR